MLSVDSLVCGECLLVMSRAAVARCNHQLPLHLIWLYLCCTLKEGNRFLENIALHIPSS